MHRVSVFPVSGSTLCLGLGWWVDSFGRFPRRVGLITYGEPHKSHLNGMLGSRRGTRRRGFSRLLFFFLVFRSSSGDWNLTGFLFPSRSLARRLSNSSEDSFEKWKKKKKRQFVWNYMYTIIQRQMDCTCTLMHRVVIRNQDLGTSTILYTLSTVPTFDE